ncbi:MAG TPA: hypothetical protein VIV60_22045 [Polyangiaceae bacterium]
MKPLTAGSEIDAWCTKCKMLLGHRIVALVRTTPARVICMTCGSEHRYLKSAPGTQSIAPVKRSSDGTISAMGKAASPKASRKAATPAATRGQAKQGEWEARVLGQAVSAFTRYSMIRKFAIGELVSHPKFGDGFVLDVVDPQKVSIMFRDGPKTLAQGQAS